MTLVEIMRELFSPLMRDMSYSVGQSSRSCADLYGDCHRLMSVRAHNGSCRYWTLWENLRGARFRVGRLALNAQGLRTLYFCINDPNPAEMGPAQQDTHTRHGGQELNFYLCDTTHIHCAFCIQSMANTYLGYVGIWRGVLAAIGARRCKAFCRSIGTRASNTWRSEPEPDWSGILRDNTRTAMQWCVA